MQLWGMVSDRMFVSYSVIIEGFYFLSCFS